MEYCFTRQAPFPGGHYSQAVIHGGFVFVAGQLPFDLTTGDLVAGGIESQTDKVIDHIEAILASAGSDLSLVVKSTVYITDMAHWPAVNAVYSRRFGEHRPARAVIPSGPLHHGALLEMEVIAALPAETSSVR